MSRLNDRAARVLARTREFVEEDEEVPPRTSPASRRSRASDKIVINDQELDIDHVVQRVRSRMTSPRSPTPPTVDPSGNPRNSPKSPKSYVERASPRSPQMSGRLPVHEVIDIARPPTPQAVSPVSSHREERERSIREMNSEQIRAELLRLRSERSIRRTNPPPAETPRTPRLSTAKERSYLPGEKIPVYDPETETWVLMRREHLPSPRHEQVTRAANPPLLRRGTTRDAYPTRAYEDQMTATMRTRNAATVDALQPEAVDEVIDIDFDAMTDVQKREFLDEMKIKFSILKKTYQDFPIPVVHDDDSPRWVYGIYEQLLDMAKGDASQPMYQSGLQLVFLIIQVVLTVAGVPAKNFFSFHSKHFHKYNVLMAELGEKWGPIVDVTSGIETKLALSIGWNTLVFAIVSVIANKFGDKMGTTIEQLLENLTSMAPTSNPKIEALQAQLEGRERVEAAPQGAPSTGQPDMMGGIANLIGGLMGGGGGGGGLANLLGGLMGGGGQPTTERKPPMYED